jgi:hypothetical protein
MQRRDFLKATLATSAVLHTAATTQAQAPSAAPSGRLQSVDTNVSLFHWPFRRLPLDGTAALLEKMTEHGIAQAWAGSFEGILHRDLAGVNQRLADECRGSGGRLVAFGSVNPALPGWEDDLRRCREVHRMPGIRLHPNYHGYTLADPRFKRLLALSTERGLLVQLAVQLEDFRTHHPMMQVADVDVTPLPGLMPATPKARVLLLNIFVWAIVRKIKRAEHLKAALRQTQARHAAARDPAAADFLAMQDDAATDDVLDADIAAFKAMQENPDDDAGGR